MTFYISLSILPLALGLSEQENKEKEKGTLLIVTLYFLLITPLSLFLSHTPEQGFPGHSVGCCVC